MSPFWHKSSFNERFFLGSLNNYGGNPFTKGEKSNDTQDVFSVPQQFILRLTASLTRWCWSEAKHCYLNILKPKVPCTSATLLASTRFNFSSLRLFCSQLEFNPNGDSCYWIRSRETEFQRLLWDWTTELFDILLKNGKGKSSSVLFKDPVL
ncbi:hypothetical protein J6590_039634 [Homalodisca vitripennis]|nr:hypothetical protein J6590_039634 [Homalodisca vitripennis]